MKFKERCTELEKIIQNAYTEGITLDEAERLAGNFLHATMQVSAELTKADLDARTRKSGVKGVRAAIYLDTVQSAEKKPTEAQIAALIDTNAVVAGEQSALDTAEVLKGELERYYDIFNQAHVYFRQMSRGVQG